LQLEGLGKLKKKAEDLIGNRTRDFPASSGILLIYAVVGERTRKSFPAFLK
jgi:hypothetical protein